MGHSSTDVASRLVYLLSELAESTLDVNEATRLRVHSRCCSHSPQYMRMASLIAC